MARSNASLVPVRGQGRTLRRPSHSWNIVAKPWQIQPVMIAPVLPGETLRNLLMQARVVTDPIKNPLIGWHCEYYFFYCKHRDLDDRDDFVEMMLDLNKDMTAFTETSGPVWWRYNFDNGIPWSLYCLERVISEYFRDEGQATLTPAVDSVPLAKLDDKNWFHSIALSSQLDSVDVTVPVDATPTPDTVSVRDIDTALRQWEFLRANNLTTMDYEQYLATYGVRPRKEELHVPELIRYVRQWQYPSNTIDPTNGTPRAAVSWALAERADKDRFFREPGFVFGVCCVRPKTYNRPQRGSVVDLMDNAFAWLPAIMQDDPATSLKLVAGGAGPFSGILSSAGTDDYVVDIRDLLVHGDQFLNFDPTAVTDRAIIDVPTTDLAEKKFAASADMDALFVSASPANRIRHDGVCQLTIATMQEDTTPSSGIRTL